MKRRTISAVVSALLTGGLGWLASGDSAQAHVFAPALLELRELDEQFGRHVTSVRWKQPRVRATGSLLEPVLPDDCVAGQPQSVIEGTGLVSTWTLECPRTLVGERIAVEGIAESGADVLLRIALEDGRTLTHILKADQPEFLVPERQTALSVFVGYTRIGIEHILSGWDHLLFVLGLVLLVGWGRKLLWTVTAFTLGHSVTLALAVLGFVKFPPQPIEALIAFSIYLLAVELARRNVNRKSLMDRMPWIVAGGFGLLHGLGFAGALQQVGLPQGEIPLALFAFNVGIELGQLAFVALILVTWAAVRAVPFEWPRWAARVPAYGIGPLAAYWFFERVAGSIGGT
ncbi:MAG: HupE/UreJ family protein [Myxococcales bacterium]|nr:HupE/UreJ family protein [Myxococcales bacterium]